jgi:hypothetical protein
MWRAAKIREGAAKKSDKQKNFKAKKGVYESCTVRGADIFFNSENVMIV